jgi:hypothetical protein
MLRRVALVRTDVSEELSASFIRVFLCSVRRLLVTASVVPSSPILVTLMMQVLSSSETSVLTRATHTCRLLGSPRGIFLFGNALRTCSACPWVLVPLQKCILWNLVGRLLDGSIIQGSKGTIRLALFNGSHKINDSCGASDCWPVAAKVTCSRIMIFGDATFEGRQSSCSTCKLMPGVVLEATYATEASKSSSHSCWWHITS